MTGIKQPQDRKPTAQEMIGSALRLQGANMAQKATLDVMGGKLIMIMAVVKKSGGQNPDKSLAEIQGILSLTREQVAERRSVNTPRYPDVEIQAAINEAADKITAILMPKADDE